MLLYGLGAYLSILLDLHNLHTLSLLGLLLGALEAALGIAILLAYLRSTTTTSLSQPPTLLGSTPPARDSFSLLPQISPSPANASILALPTGC